jgi:hypothetical protein
LRGCGELGSGRLEGHHTVRRPSEIDPTNLRDDTVLEAIFLLWGLQSESGCEDVHRMEQFVGDDGASQVDVGDQQPIRSGRLEARKILVKNKLLVPESLGLSR